MSSEFRTESARTFKYQHVITNKARCKKCGETIESVHRHDFVRCGCGAIAVDGGKEYLRRVGDLEAFEELSETEEREGTYSWAKAKESK